MRLEFRDRISESVCRCRGSPVLIALLRGSSHKVDQMGPRRPSAFRRRQPDALSLESLSNELEARIVAPWSQRRHEVIEPPLHDAGRSRVDDTKRDIRHSRLVRERRAKEKKVEDRIFIALCDACANRAVVVRDPRGPYRLELGRILASQLQRLKPGLQRFENSACVRVRDVAALACRSRRERYPRAERRLGWTPAPLPGRQQVPQPHTPTGARGRSRALRTMNS